MRISASRNSQRYTVQGPIRSALELVQPSLLGKHKSKKKELDLKISKGKKNPVTEPFASKWNCLHGARYTLHMCSFSFCSEITASSHLIKEHQLKSIRCLFLACLWAFILSWVH